MIAPIITFRAPTNPFNALSMLTYAQSGPGGTDLPVLQGSNSDHFVETGGSLFRVYNNFGLSASVATALNFYLTTYDGPTSVSHTCAVLPVSQSWVHVLENGYGENSVTFPDNETNYVGADTAIGGCPAGANKYYPEKGSDGATPQQSRIRAYSNNNGVGFIEFKSYASVPGAAPNNTYTFAVSANYEWTS